jgi:hypothetical protein
MTQQPNENELPNEIFKRWTHSHEEDSNGIIVYRPAEFKFPISRPRDGIEFRKDGTFIDWDIHPADGPAAPMNGRWQMIGPRHVRVSFEQGRRHPSVLEIVQYDSELLKIQRKTATTSV